MPPSQAETHLWMRAVRDVGFPIVVALVLLWAFVFRVPEEIARLTAAMQARGGQLDELLKGQQQVLATMQRLLERKG